MFTLNGVREKRTLSANQIPMPPTAANIKFAERMVVDIKNAIRLDRFNVHDFFPEGGVVKTGLTVGDQIDLWLSVQRLEASSRQAYKAGANHWKKATCNAQGKKLGDMQIPALTHTHVKFAIAQWTKSGKTMNNYLQVLREAMGQAKYEGLTLINPVIDPKTEESFSMPYQKPDADPFSATEVDQIIASMREKYPEQIANFTEFWMWTGLRTAELFALQWESVDFANGYFAVNESLVRGVHKKKTKTNYTRRVKLNSRALAALTRQRQHTQLAGGRIFQDPRYDQAWIDERAFRRSFWAPTLKRLGIRYRRPYNCRHTYATALIMANANHKWASLQMGHSVEMFQKTYTKWIDGDQNEAEMAKLEANLKTQIVPGLSPERVSAT